MPAQSDQTATAALAVPARPPMIDAARRSAALLGLGHYLPEGTITNQDLARLVDTSDDWITPRTGIRSRHMAAPAQATSDLAAGAAAEALRNAGIAAADLDLILLATATPDAPVPPASSIVQLRLEAWNAAAMDISAACAGFVFAAHTAAGLIRAGVHRHVLVVGAEVLTRITDYSDRATCVLFGDGAGAFVLGPAGEHPARPTLVYSRIGTDGRDADLIQVPAGGSRLPASHDTVERREHFLRLDGRAVFRRAVEAMSGAAREALRTLGLAVSDLRWLIPHQANSRIVHAVAAALGARPDQVVDELAATGNTSAASLPVALSRALGGARPETGDIFMLLTFGAGCSWGCQVYQQTSH